MSAFLVGKPFHFRGLLSSLTSHRDTRDLSAKETKGRGLQLASQRHSVSGKSTLEVRQCRAIMGGEAELARMSGAPSNQRIESRTLGVCGLQLVMSTARLSVSSKGSCISQGSEEGSLGDRRVK